MCNEIECGRAVVVVVWAEEPIIKHGEKAIELINGTKNGLFCRRTVFGMLRWQWLQNMHMFHFSSRLVSFDISVRLRLFGFDLFDTC